MNREDLKKEILLILTDCDLEKIDDLVKNTARFGYHHTLKTLKDKFSEWHTASLNIASLQQDISSFTEASQILLNMNYDDATKLVEEVLDDILKHDILAS